MKAPCERVKKKRVSPTVDHIKTCKECFEFLTEDLNKNKSKVSSEKEE